MPPASAGAAQVLLGDGLDRAERYAWRLSTSAVAWGLMGPREAERVWDRHVLNCAAITPLIPDGVRVMDVGSGAGLPGVVLAIARPDLTVELVEPLQRRVDWLSRSVADLDLPNVTVIRARAEDLAGRHPAADVVCARAVAPLARLAGWCLPLLRGGGELLAMKGASAAEELRSAEGDLRRQGASAWSVVECAEGVLDPPVRVIRVVGGRVGGMGPGARRAGRRAPR